MSLKQKKKKRNDLAKKSHHWSSKGKKARPALLKASTTTDYRRLLHDLEKRPFFELSASEKTAIRRLEKQFGSKIEAWSFIPHPDVLNAIQGDAGQRLIRFIFTVDTLMAKAYFAVQEFLQAQKINVNSYFSGGWADFVCEAHLTEKQFESLITTLKGILSKAGAAKMADEENVNELISVFRVTNTLILCGKKISSVARPDPEILEEIKSAPAKFEVVYRNYQSEEARKYFPSSEKGLRAYIKKLETGHVILCYKVVFDRSRHFEWDYVPVQRARRLLHIAEPGIQQTKLLRPVVDLVEVNPINAVDKEESEVTHIFINEYDFPGERQDWKKLIYESVGDNANLYTYPLEGTLNESPIYLSDIPEILERSAHYKAGDILLGEVHHPLIKSPPEVRLGLNSFKNHGVTFGMPGSGKTNTDMLLVEQIASLVSTVLILDASQSAKGKLSVIKPDIGKRIKQYGLLKDAGCQKIADTVSVVLEHGLHLIEPHRLILPAVLDELIKRIEEIPDATTGNQIRRVNGLLLIEEANDAFGSGEQERDERLRSLEMLLNKASRKGWSIWLSTQYPSQLGRDDETRLRILRLLKNRVIHSMGNEEEMNLLLKVMESDGFSSEDRQYVQDSLKAFSQPEKKGCAIVCGTENDDQGSHLRPVTARIRKLPTS